MEFSLEAVSVAVNVLLLTAIVWHYLQKSPPSTSIKRKKKRSTSQRSAAPAVSSSSVSAEDWDRFRAVAAAAQEDLLRQSADDADGWTLSTERKGVKVYRKGGGGGGGLQTRGVAVLEHPASAVRAILEDTDRIGEWDGQFLAQRVLLREGGGGGVSVVHTTYKGKWPIKGRDTVVCQSAAVLDDEDGAFVVAVRSLDESDAAVPAPSREYVRATVAGGGFVVRPLSDGSCRVAYIAAVDLKGGLPAALKALLAIKTCLGIAKIRAILDREQDEGEQDENGDGDGNGDGGQTGTSPSAADLHPLVAAGEIFISAGVFDAMSAKLAERAGFRSPSRFCRTLFRIERVAVHSYGPDPHSC